MSSLNTISIDKLTRLIGTPACPTLIDVQTDEDFAADPRLVPGAVRRTGQRPRTGRPNSPGNRPSSSAKRGSNSAKASLPGCGMPASPLRRSKAVRSPGERPGCRWCRRRSCRRATARAAPFGSRGRGPKVDRIACPWLIRRFVDPNAVFLFVTPSEVPAVAERFGAAPFDIEGEGVFWSHRGELCTFDVMIEEFGLHIPALDRLALIVRGADTARPDLAPEAPGLLAASLGLSRMFADDLPQLEAGMLLYDAFYRWCRDATSETHNWPVKRGA